MVRKAKSTVQKLKDRAETLWKECCLARDGKMCQVKMHYPSLGIKHSDVIQVDHCIGRKCSELKFYVPNGTPICSTCNRMKHYQQKSIHRLVDEIVIKREGVDEFNKMKAIDMKKGAFTDFSKVWWLEKVITHLEGELQRIWHGHYVKVHMEYLGES